MKQLLITIAALVLVGCGPPSVPDISIHDAAFRGNIGAVRRHLAAGTDVNEKEIHKIDPRRRGVITTIVHTPLHYAAIEGHKEIAELLIAKGADVNFKGGDVPRTALHYAAENHEKEIVELLIANGANVNDRGNVSFFNIGITPLDEIIPIEKTKEEKVKIREIIKLLRKHGGKKDAELRAAGN